MNLFDNIIQSNFNQFKGTPTPSVPSFATPQSPRTSSYVAPNAPYTAFQQPQAQVVPQPVQNDASIQLKQKYGFNDKDIEFLKQAKQKGYDSTIAFNYITNKKEQEKQGPDLGVMGSIKEGAIGAFRAGEQIPRIAGAGMDFLTQNVTGPLIAGGLDLVGADNLADRWRTASKTAGEGFKNIGEDITKAGEGNITDKQRSARRVGGELALTAPIGGGYLAGAKGVGSLAIRSGVVGTGFGATQPIIDKGAEATVGDIGQGAVFGGVTGAVAGPVIAKVIAPAIGGVASKTLKYGKAGYYGGVEGAGKSIARDITEVKTGIQKGIQNRADIASTNINRMNAGQIRSFNEEIGVSPGKFLNDRGMNDTGDDLVENLSKNLKLSRKAADDGLANIQGNFKAPTQEVATSTLDDTGKFVTKQVDPVGTMLMDNLENASSKGMSKESLRAKQLLEKYQEQGLSMTEINEAKRFLNGNNKFSYFSDDTSPRKGFVTNLDSEVRKWQFATAEQQGFSNLGAINMDTKAYYKLLEGIGGWQDKIAGNNPMGLTDWLAFNADPSVFLAKQVAQSNIAKRTYLKSLNALGGRKVQPETKLPTNISKNGIPNSNNSNNVSSYKRSNVVKSDITTESKILRPSPLKKEIPKKLESKPLVKTPKSGEIDANKFVKSKNPDITLTTFEGPDEINLYRLEIPKASRKEGKGTKAMNDLIEYADKNGKRIVLTPDNYAGSSVSRLKEFYKRFGFVENTGKNKDFSTRELMYRSPKPLSNESKVIKPTTGNTVPEGSTKNDFGEIIKKPGNKNGGFIRNPFAKSDIEISKKSDTYRINYEVKEGGKRIGEMIVDKEGYGKNQWYLNFIGLEKTSQGKGYSKKMISQVVEDAKKSGVKTLLVEPTNQRAYLALEKSLGKPTSISNDITELTKEKALASIPEKDIYVNGDLDTSNRVMLEFNISKTKSTNKLINKSLKNSNNLDNDN